MRMALLSISAGDVAISILFGVAQVIAGYALARRLARGDAWHLQSVVIGGMVGVGLLASGVAELIVALANILVGNDGGRVALVRSIVDAILFGIIAILLVALLGYVLLRRQQAMMQKMRGTDDGRAS